MSSLSAAEEAIALPPEIRSGTQYPLSVQVAALKRLGIGKPVIANAASLARRNGTSLEDELFSSGIVQETLYFEAIAHSLGLRFLRVIDPTAIILSASIDVLLTDPRRPLRVDTHDGRTITVIAPVAAEAERLSRLLEDHPGLRESFAVAPPSAVRAAVWSARSERRVAETVGSLFDSRPRLSARFVATGRQGFAIGVVLAGLMAAGLVAWNPTLAAVHVALTSLFAACVWLRATASAHWQERTPHYPTVLDDARLPIYTVMVAMYQEAPVVRQLVGALDKLDWPRSKLDIKLVCEANDGETIKALEELRLRPEYEIVRVPRVAPFTKPKALCYAMAGARGEFTVIYDAEDRPHPEQLREAHARFLAGGPRLACIQAPLVIANAGRTWLTSMFALEYCGLFRGILPFLAKVGLPLPLGGTSNHLRSNVLREVGGWDPFNVTEDADLGLRLARGGYRFAIITRPTLEDAPTSIRVWVLQRSRWFKGWLQTWLVMMRHPVQLCRDFGPVGFLTSQILTAGMLASALLSPLMLYFILSSALALLLGHRDTSTLGTILLVVDLAVVISTFIVFILLGFKPMTMKERFQIGRRWAWLPVYWTMMSWAAWRAVFQLMNKPFHWEKTPHEPTARRELDG
ncbi:glycosyltransferase family 2 protein [Pararhizobium haloflavum]|uniref:glycosyltransferase family 2 protein n=1 Tax=Pararhizobium haloflavum TaxID=2037914 RepID=UPI000C1A39BC|nr:glycosyltransferase family 2 protein [Pararhizobium haloflavum]